METSIITVYWMLCIVAPLTGAILTFLLSRFHRLIAPVLGILSVGSAAVGSISLALSRPWEAADYSASDHIFRVVLPYFRTTDQTIINLALGIQLDALSVTLAVVSATLGTLIAIFSIGYMKDEQAWMRYWFFLQLFIAGMELLVLAADIILLYVGWETVGLCSFALIGHWHYKEDIGYKCKWAGFKAFAVTRIGDIGLLSGLIMLYGYTGKTLLTDIAAQLPLLSQDTLSWMLGLLMIGAIGKSAQFPFIGWLSSPDSVDIDAMQGPTTVSALIHAATMVKAGVYLLARTYLVFRAADLSKTFAYTLGGIAILTALITALAAAAAADLKRILAYSTVSQLAYMFVGLSAAYYLNSLGTEQALAETAFLAAIFHLASHAVFKALLFLTVGAMIHATGSRLLADNGNLWARSKLLSIGLIVGASSLAGLPLFSGYWSKEAILGVLYETHHGSWNLTLYVLGALTAGITAFYSARLVLLTLFGPTPKNHFHAPDWSMKLVVALLSLTVFAVSALVSVLPTFFEDLVKEAEFEWLPHGDAWISTAIVLGCILVGLLFCLLAYGLHPRSYTTSLPGRIPLGSLLYTLSKNGFYVDQVMTWIGTTTAKLSYCLRKIHTGDVNYNMLGLQVVFTLVLGILVLGGL